MLTSIYAIDILGIVNSTHSSPHYILGMHMVEVKVDQKTKKIPSARIFLPDAKQVFVIDKKDQTKWEMELIHSEGLFEALVWDRNEKFSYYYEITGLAGQTWTMEDPYEDWVEEMTPFDQYLFNRSQHYQIYEKMGAHIRTINGKKGVFFSVWAPNAQRVSVIGNFNSWDGRKDPLEKLNDSGVWVLFKPGIGEGEVYKFEIKTKGGHLFKKADPYANYSELRPRTASIVHQLPDYQWKDEPWIKKRSDSDFINQPISIYEVHLGSWKKSGPGEDDFLTYTDLADQLVEYVKDMGFTHIELMPIAEHPFDGSWGYQVTGYYSPTSRFGKPEELQYFIDRCHQENIGVILDWVPGHFPKDAHSLIEFDGSALYEHSDPRLGEHMDWGTKVFNYGRYEVKNFLIANAMYWLDKFHFDGLRVDAVASMLYLDYSRKEGEWVTNQFGGRENLEAIEFMQHLNSILHHYYPGILMIAEESTSYPGVSKPTYIGGLGFGFKWNMGWMNDTLNYMSKDPVYRKYHHGELTFSFLYAWSENFILPISHDEVVHGKGSLISKMPGDYWQKFANLRAFYTYMWTHPGKQLLFMGQEFGQFDEWNHSKSLDWHLLDFEFHKGLQKMIKDLNHIYVKENALWQKDTLPNGFEGINCDDADNSVISFIRKGKDNKDFLIIAVNFTPVPRSNYLLGVPLEGFYQEIFNSDSSIYGGSNFGNMGGVETWEEESYGKPYSIKVNIPPLGGVILKLGRKKTKY
ncbi:MAG: 1,4-alpha-glucan branching protein GlgB [Spirochaetes bacterium]|nr:1,4-alpha-glucan branching protein GlgB [Spirochaetota bacterium]